MDSTGRVDDEELVGRCKSGDETAFNELIERYKKMGFSLAYNMTGSIEDAEDISQEAFVVVYSKLKMFREESSFKTWFYKIVLNLCRRHHRRMKLVSFFPFIFINREGEEQSVDVKTESTPENELSSRQTGMAIISAIKKLPLKQREVFVMKHIKGMKINRIADVLDSSEGTIKSHLFRAIKKLRDELGSL